MRVAVAAGGASRETVDFVVEAERLGADSVWVAEAWGFDALTPLAFLAAKTDRIHLATGIAQLGARSPAMLAMSAMSMQALSNGRFRLGLGTSGPQVMEGWHGVRFEKPVATTRTAIEVIRTITAGERLVLEGGPSRGMRSMAPAAHVPIYLASLGPRNLELTGELADGWLGNAFLVDTAKEAFLDPLERGAAKAGRTLADLDLVVPVAVEVTDDEEEAARRHARGYAFTIGAMGSRDTNFYNAAFARQGFGDDVAAVQQLWIDGRRDEAADRVPVALGRGTNLLGPVDVIRRRVAEYRAIGVTTLQAKLSGSLDERLATLATLIEICGEGA